MSLEAAVELNEPIVQGHPTAAAPREVVIVTKASDSFCVMDVTSKVAAVCKLFSCNR